MTRLRAGLAVAADGQSGGAVQSAVGCRALRRSRA